MKRRLLVLFMIAGACPRNGTAMSDAEFQLRSQELGLQQKKADALMKRLGVTSGLGQPRIGITSPNPDDSESVSKPLFRNHSELSERLIPAGKLLYGRTLNRLIVGPEGSPVIVTLDREQGSLSQLRVLGTAKQSSAEGRVTLELNRLALKNGKIIPILGVGLDQSGAYGIESEIFSGKAIAVGGAMASSFISGFAASQQSQNVNGLGFSTTQPNGRNALLQGVAQTAADQAKRLIEDSSKEKPILLIDSSTQIAILIQEEVRL